MAIKFCQISDSRFETAVVVSPAINDRIRFSIAEEALLVRLKAIAVGLKKIGVRFGYGKPRFLDWERGEFQWRADCIAIKPSSVDWDVVYAAISQVKAVPYDAISNKHAENLLIGMTLNV